MNDATVSGAQRGDERGDATARNLAFEAGLCLVVCLLVAGGLFARWVLVPPLPEICPLPALNVHRPGDLFAWSPDGRRLLVVNRFGEGSVVRFPDLAVEDLPPFPQAPWGAGWDSAERPLVVHRIKYPLEGLARLDRVRSRWERLPLRGALMSVSPEGRLLALLEGWTRVRVFDLESLHPLPELPAADVEDVYQIRWGDARTLLVNGAPAPTGGPWSTGSAKMTLQPGDRRGAIRRCPSSSATNLASSRAPNCGGSSGSGRSPECRIGRTPTGRSPSRLPRGSCCGASRSVAAA